MSDTTYGTLLDRPRDEALGAFEIRFVPLDFVVHWRRCGLTADYLGAAMAYAFERREAAAAVLSTVINELVENAVKFSDDKRTEARVSVVHDGDVLCVEAVNLTDAKRAGELHAFAREFEHADPEAMFLERVARTTRPGESASGIGLLVLKKDYDATIGIRVRPVEGGRSEVTVQAVLTSEQVEAR
ncbi:MAG TPA: hypothetical protein VF765_09325 [Polyangiaceae bacterium]